jgi:nitrilase
MRRSDGPADYHPVQGDAAETIVIGGGSVIVSPLGQILAGPDRSGECLLTAELDLDEVVRGKYDLDVVGHYARPDVFSLLVNEAPQRTVQRCSDEVSDPNRA